MIETMTAPANNGQIARPPKVGDYFLNSGTLVRVIDENVDSSIVGPAHHVRVVIAAIGGQGGAGQQYVVEPRHLVPALVA